MVSDPEIVDIIIQPLREIMLFDPETTEATIKFAMYIGFAGIAGGSFIGVLCRAIMSVVNIFDKITK